MARSRPADVDGLFDAGLARGRQRIAFASARPKTSPIFKRQTRLTFARCGIIDPLSLDDYEAHGGYRGLERALAVTGAEAIVEEVVQVGPARPRRRRLSHRHQMADRRSTTPPQQKYIVCNADEGDSGTFADRMIMEGDPFLLIEGMTIAGIAVGATEGYVYIRSEYPHAIAADGDAIDVAREAGCSAPTSPGSATPSTSRCASAPAPMSAARRPSLLESLEGKRGVGARQAAAAGACRACSASRPSSTTCCRSPSVPIILAEGAAFYRDFGMGRSRGTMPIQLAGNVKHGGLFETAFGITLRELVDDIGGGTRDRPAGARGAGRRAARRLFPARRCSTRPSTTRPSPPATG